MTIAPVKPNWIDRAIQIRKWHVQQCRDDSTWTISKTADALNRSIGSISQDILIAEWMMTHEKQIRRCGSMRDALAYIKGLKREQELRV